MQLTYEHGFPLLPFLALAKADRVEGVVVAEVRAEDVGRHDHRRHLGPADEIFSSLEPDDLELAPQSSYPSLSTSVPQAARPREGKGGV